MVAFAILGFAVFWYVMYPQLPDHGGESELTLEHIAVPTLLRHNLKAGDSWKMLVDSEISDSKSTIIGIKGTVDIKCLAVNEDRARYTATFSKFVLSGSGTAGQSPPDEMVIETTKDLRGKTLSSSVNGILIPTEEGIGTSDLLLPEGPVKSGDKWEALIKSPPIEAIIVYTLVGRTQHQGRPAYCIKGSFKEGEMLTDDPGYMYLVDTETLQTIKLTGGFKSKDGYRGRFEATQVTE